jgi:hypothetical protein
MKRFILTMVWIGLVLLSESVEATAQSPSVTLTGRAILAAESYAQGPKSGAALTGGAATKTINGVRAPFTSQPAGSISAVTKGWYRNTWLLLTDKGLGTADSGDFLLRAYTVEADWMRGSSGSGAVTILDWVALTDPRKLIAKITSTDRNRPLSGDEFDPRSIALVQDGTLWIGDAKMPALLHFSKEGALLEAPRALTGQLLGLGTAADGSRLLIGTRDGNSVTLRYYTPSSGALDNTRYVYPLDNAGNTLSEITPINDRDVLIIEQDANRGVSAKQKTIYLATLANGTVSKRAIADLLNITDSAKIATNSAFGRTAGQFGLASPFKFPYDVSGVYPIDGSTLAVVNNNHFPFSTARQSGVADPTELILLRLNTALSITLPDLQE